MGPGAHVVAVCQPCVAALVAAAVMAKNGMKAQPKSLTLMAGPIDCRVNPTKVNELATGKPIEWFEKNLISVVPPQHKGAGRHVYPGFVQLSAFMSMNMDRHVKAHMDLYQNLARGEFEKAKQTKDFYDEYFAVLDLTAEFYLETVQWVFQEFRLPKGELKFQGELVEPKAIRKTSLLTVEGSATISARWARRWLRRIYAPAFVRTGNAITCRPASAIMASSPARSGTARFIRLSAIRSSPQNSGRRIVRCFRSPSLC